MCTAIIRAALFITLLAVVGCQYDGNGDHENNGAPADDSIIGGNYTGPEFEFLVEPTDRITTLSWSVVVPTGGWTLRTATARYDDTTNTMRLYVVLIEPDPDMMVTQALETLRDNLRMQRDIDHAVLFVKQLEHNQPPDEVQYDRVADWP